MLPNSSPTESQGAAPADQASVERTVTRAVIVLRGNRVLLDADLTRRADDFKVANSGCVITPADGPRALPDGNVPREFTAMAVNSRQELAGWFDAGSQATEKSRGPDQCQHSHQVEGRSGQRGLCTDAIQTSQ